jgi:hypothetical protein
VIRIWRKSEEHYKSAGLLLLAAQQRVKEIGVFGWKEWLEKNSSIQYTRVRELISIADGSKTVAGVRLAIAERAAKHRAEKKVEAEKCVTVTRPAPVSTTKVFDIDDEMPEPVESAEPEVEDISESVRCPAQKFNIEQRFKIFEHLLKGLDELAASLNPSEKLAADLGAASSMVEFELSRYKDLLIKAGVGLPESPSEPETGEHPSEELEPVCDPLLVHHVWARHILPACHSSSAT